MSRLNPSPWSLAAPDIVIYDDVTWRLPRLLVPAGYDAAGGPSATTAAPLSFLRDCTRGWNGGFLPSCGHDTDVVIACAGEGKRWSMEGCTALACHVPVRCGVASKLQGCRHQTHVFLTGLLLAYACYRLGFLVLADAE